MLWLWITLSVLILVSATFVFASLYVYRICFVNPEESRNSPPDYLDSDEYRKYSHITEPLIEKLKNEPFEAVSITASDGAVLFARYYENSPGAPVDIMMHGYKGHPEYEFCCGYFISKEMGHNALIVDERACGKSGGKAVTFGIKERYDCLEWISYILKRNGKDTVINLVGISMGAATVLMVAGMNPPENVKAVVSDCGYTSVREIIMSVARSLKFPAGLVYFMAKTTAKMIGGFDIESFSPIYAVTKSTIPTLFIHGTADTFVPYYMGEQLYAAATCPKDFLPGEIAGHGMAFFADPKKYISCVKQYLS